jgi:hypothetical protein
MHESWKKTFENGKCIESKSNVFISLLKKKFVEAWWVKNIIEDLFGCHKGKIF